MSRPFEDLFEKRNLIELFLGLPSPNTIRQAKKAAARKNSVQKAAPPAPAPVVVLQPTPVPAPVPVPIPAPVSASVPEPAPSTAEQASATGPDSAVAEPAAAEDKPAQADLTWTDMEDATLIGLKALNKTWKEIGAAIEGKHTEDLRARYDTLIAPPAEEKAAENSAAKSQDKVEKAPKGDTDKTKEVGVQGNEGDGAPKEASGKKAEKQHKKHKKGKLLSEEAQEQKAKATDGTADGHESQAEAAKNKGGKGKSGKKKELKGILKKGAASPGVQSDEEPSSHDGRPIIYVDNGDGLNINELMFLYQLHHKLDQKKWLELSSKFFDKTGKRASPELLKEKMKNC